jgi:hypothetical protein
MGDLDGDGHDEIYSTDNSGNVYGYDNVSGWRLLASYPDMTGMVVNNGDTTTVRWPGATRDEVLFSGAVSGTTFRVLRLSSPAPQGCFIDAPAEVFAMI